MIWRSREPRYDVASGISQGARDYQEDAITADFPVGAEAGFVVLADGMGGHAAGDVASKIVLTEVFSELKFHFADVVAFENRLYWISVGDSPLFLYRNGKLSQLNEDHSMAPQIDFMVKSGLMDPQVAANHPDRNCLISVLMGTRIPKIDCPTKYRKTRSTEIAERLLEELAKLGDPDQDNISFTVIKVNDASVRPKEERPRGPSMSVARPRRLTTVVSDHAVLPIPKPLPLPVPGPETKVARTPRPPVRAVQESNPAHGVEDLSAVRLRPRRVTVIK